jgi:hypothetical protein
LEESGFASWLSIVAQDDRKPQALRQVIATEILGLNTDLVRSGSIGHDIGHVPFGHRGEEWMAKAMGPVICQKIERKGKGLNLTWHTLDAMLRHSGTMARPEMSQEAWVLRFTDKMAYLFADLNDILMRMEYPASHALLDLAATFGKTQRERSISAIAGLVIESAECGRVSFEKSDLGQRFKQLRKLMYEEVYPRVTQQDVGPYMEPVLEMLTTLKIGDPFLILALMTDKDVRSLVNAPMRDMQAFHRTAVNEIVPYLHEIGTVDLCDPDLDW